MADCFGEVWVHNTIEDIKLDISSGKYDAGLIKLILDNNPTLSSLVKILGSTTDIALDVKRMIDSKGHGIFSDKAERLHDEDSRINVLVRAMKNVQRRLKHDMDALLTQKTFYIKSLPGPYRNFFKGLECPPDNTIYITKEKELVKLFEKCFDQVKADYDSYYSVQIIRSKGPSIILNHCRSTMTIREAEKKIEEYMSIPCSLLLKNCWFERGLRKKCVEVGNNEMANIICKSP